MLEHDHYKSILSLNILQSSGGKQKIELTYRNAGGPEHTRDLVASFIVPRMDRRWVIFSLTVVQQEVTLYYSGCDRVLKTLFQHPRRDLAVHENSPIFLGNAGWYIQKPVLYVRFCIFIPLRNNDACTRDGTVDTSDSCNFGHSESYEKLFDIFV